MHELQKRGARLTNTAQWEHSFTSYMFATLFTDKWIPYSLQFACQQRNKKAEKTFLRRNLNRQQAFRYRTQSYRHHKSGTHSAHH